MTRVRVAGWLLLGGLIILARPAEAAQNTVPSGLPGSPTAPAQLADPPFTFDGPPAPVPPAVINRDEAGRATIRAVRLTSPLQLDGQLDEEIYTSVPSSSDMVQVEPQAGSLATEQTAVWVTFDHEHIYVSLRCWESQPERMVLNEMRRDNVNLYSNDHVDIILDTFYDRRNAVFFAITAIGGRADGEVADERQFLADWNPVWDARVGRFDGGWTAEVAIPFKSLRYRPGRAQIWSFNIQRENFAHNEISTLTRMPAALGARAIMQISLAPTLVGLEVPAASRKLDIKPYLVTELTSDRTMAPEISDELGGDIGFDVRYGLGQNFTADLTYNTDFAQVEADEQQVNLTRFSLFFPEKREFFLENQGLFTFGGAGAGPFGGGGDTPLLFYSRQIGLQDGQEVPIVAGGRLTGRVGKFSVGVLNVQADGEPVSGAQATNFSVVRVKRDILRRSSVGAIFTGRSASTNGPGSNQAYGLDGTFAFYDNLTINTYWAQTQTPELGEDEDSYRGQLDYRGDRYGVQLERLVVGDDFNPEVGFLRREDFERSFGLFRFSPRPRSIAAIRKLTWQGRFDYITDRGGVLETREAQGLFGIEFENTDLFEVAYTRSYEFLDRPFQIAPAVTIPVGGYSFQDVRASLTLGSQRRLAGTVAVQHGGFFSGDRTSVDFTRGHLEITRQLSVEPGLSLNWVDLPEGSFTTELVTTRTTYTVTPLMFVSALVQYNTGNNSLGANLRFRWEYQPGSELFVVYNEQRDTLTPRFPELENRAFIIKINRLFRF